MTSSSPPNPADRRHQALVELAARSREAPRRAGLDRAATDAITALEHAGVEALLLKGSALAQTLYAPDRQRSYYDVDLLVAAPRLTVAAAVLSQLGYHNVARAQGIEDVGAAPHAELWTRLDDAFGNVSIDLHRKLAGCSAHDERIWELLRAGAQEIEVNGRNCLTLSDAGLALHLALHLAQHGTADVKATSDLRLGLDRWPPEVWREASALAVELGGDESFAAGLRLIPEGELTADALGIGGGERVLRDLEQRDSRPRGTFHLEALTHAGTVSERLGILRRSLLPSPNWIRWEMAWAGSSKVHLLAGYLVHLARVPLWAVRAARFTRQQRR